MKKWLISNSFVRKLAVDLIIETLMILASRTENTVDDRLVARVDAALNTRDVT